MARVLVLGYIVRRPLGGGTWPTLQYALGLQQLGHDVYFVEDSEDWGMCYDPTRHVTDEDPTFGLQYAKDVFDRVGLGDRWGYFDAHTNTWFGPQPAEMAAICRSADALINNSGINPIRPWLEDVPKRIYIDTDPAFEQVRQLTDSFRRERREQHNVFVTLGENIPTGQAEVPDDGVPWQPSRQPVVLDQWSVTPGPEDGRYTTVMLWDSYATREYEGRHYGMKSESFEPFLDLPERLAMRDRMELAVGGPNVPTQRLRDGGWGVVNPLEPTRDPWIYQAYLRDSKAEFTVAKHGYVVSRCGWFSERSAHYLATGRPVITQDTGFGTVLPSGQGLLAYSTFDEAAAALAEVERDYADHCRAAREVAEAHFDAKKVLARLLELTP